MATAFEKRKLSGFINNTNEKMFLKAVQCDRDALRFYHQLLLTSRADHMVPNRGKQNCMYCNDINSFKLLAKMWSPSYNSTAVLY